MPRREDHPRDIHHARLLLRRGLMALGGLRIRVIALVYGRVRGGIRIERRHWLLLLTTTPTPLLLLPASACATPILRIGALLGLTLVALVVLAAAWAPLVTLIALVALIGVAPTLRRPLWIVLIATGATTLAAWRLFLLGATALSTLAIRIRRLLIGRSGRIDGVRLAAARLLTALLSTLAAGVAATTCGIRLRRPLWLRILRLAWLTALLAALLSAATRLLGSAATWRIRHRAATAGALRATVSGLLAARRGGLSRGGRLTICALGRRLLWRGRRRLAHRAAIWRTRAHIEAAAWRGRLGGWLAGRRLRGGVATHGGRALGGFR
jgi:hypothetical protein